MGIPAGYLLNSANPKIAPDDRDPKINTHASAQLEYLSVEMVGLFTSSSLRSISKK